MQIIQDVDGFPKNRAGAVLADQIIRSIGSIGANISEGFNRSKKKYLNSLDIAVGEAAEAENWLYKIRDASFLEPDLANERVRESIEVQKMLHGLIRSIRRSGEDS